MPEPSRRRSELPAAELTGWSAADWGKIEQIWRDLVGPPNADPADHLPKFAGVEIAGDEAGYVFQKWILEAFRVSGASVEGPFLVPMTSQRNAVGGRALAEQLPRGRTTEEIDGLVLCDWQAFAVECKFEKVDFDPIARLHLVAERRPVGTLGLLFTPFGFTEPALELVAELRPIRVLLFHYSDIDFAVHTRDFLDTVYRKWRAAVKYGLPYLPVHDPRD